MNNLYLALSVAPSASAAAIKRAYRDLARKHHPDHGGDAARFAAVDEAYQVLSDPGRRAEYDAMRAAWLESVGAVGCSGCGEANRIRAVSAGKIPVCAECGTALSPAKKTSPLYQRAADAGIDLAERGIDHTAAILATGVDLTFAKLRGRLSQWRKGAR